MKQIKFLLISTITTLLALTSKTAKTHHQNKKKETAKCEIQSIDSALKDGVLKEQNYFPFAPIIDRIQLFSEPNNSMFYWLFPSKRNSSTDPVLIWLQGGPGCASTGGLFRENGPYYVDTFNSSDPKAKHRTISWNAQANVLYVDQPLGIGFSTVTTEHLVKSWKEVSEQFLLFYELFLAKHPEFKGRTVYVSGESYGGHWVPYTAYGLFLSDDPDINLKGFVIGNGLIDYKWMSVDYPSFSYKNREHTNFTQKDLEDLQPSADLCRHLMDFKPMPAIVINEDIICDNISATIQQIANDYQNKTYGRPFDVYYMPSDWPQNNSFIEFLNDPGVQRYLNVDKEFDECNNTFNAYFRPIDDRTDSRDMMVPMLEAGVKVWVYDGDQDWICNYEQEEQTLDTMVWSGRNEWLKASFTDCDYGKCKRAKNLRYVRFAGAGHMVPMYKPVKALEMINEFMDWAAVSDGSDVSDGGKKE